MARHRWTWQSTRRRLYRPAACRSATLPTCCYVPMEDDSSLRMHARESDRRSCQRFRRHVRLQEPVAVPVYRTADRPVPAPSCLLQIYGQLPALSWRSRQRLSSSRPRQPSSWRLLRPFSWPRQPPASWLPRQQPSWRLPRLSSSLRLRLFTWRCRPVVSLQPSWRRQPSWPHQLSWRRQPFWPLPLSARPSWLRPPPFVLPLFERTLLSFVPQL